MHPGSLPGYGQAPRGLELPLPPRQARLKRRPFRVCDFEICRDPCEMSSENIAAVAEFIKGAPPGEVPSDDGLHAACFTDSNG